MLVSNLLHACHVCFWSPWWMERPRHAVNRSFLLFETYLIRSHNSLTREITLRIADWLIHSKSTRSMEFEPRRHCKHYTEYICCIHGPRDTQRYTRDTIQVTGAWQQPSLYIGALARSLARSCLLLRVHIASTPAHFRHTSAIFSTSSVVWELMAKWRRQRSSDESENVIHGRRLHKTTLRFCDRSWRCRDWLRSAGWARL